MRVMILKRLVLRSADDSLEEIQQEDGGCKFLFSRVSSEEGPLSDSSLPDCLTLRDTPVLCSPVYATIGDAPEQFKSRA